jgi:hypothetical protein
VAAPMPLLAPVMTAVRREALTGPSHQFSRFAQCAGTADRL